MKRIAVIGSGIAGLLTAHGLRRAGYEVTLFSDRTPDQWLHESTPTGTAGRFEMVLAWERELGLAHWEPAAPHGMGVHVTFCPAPGNRLITLTGRMKSHFLAIDVRLQSHRWMLDLERIGGRVRVESVTVDRLDAIAAEHDLTVVGVGRGELARLFERDATRSHYEDPQRHLAMLCVRGPKMGFIGVPFLPVKFNLFAGLGEAFWVPYHHKDVGPSWNLVFEAIPGGPFDRFGAAKSGEEALAIGKELTREYVPWDYDWLKDAELSDPRGWLVGRITPTVREPVARLPSGRIVTGVGDTLVSVDPASGQGANSGSKMARNLVESVVAHGDRPFDAAFMRQTFDRYYRRHGEMIMKFNDLFLEPLTPAAREILIAQYGCDGTGGDGRQRIANAFMDTFDDPAELTPALLDRRIAHDFIARTTGRPWWAAVLAGGARVAWQQIRGRLGLPQRHPAALPAIPSHASAAPLSAAS
jgi:hypothetical protein